MPLTAYGGILAGDMPLMSVTGAMLTTGRAYFVDSNYGSNNNDGRDPGRPFATLAQALLKARANLGDQIHLMPGHAETTTAVAISTAGIDIVGHGVGRNRPTLTATTATSDLINVTAANVRMRNIRLVGAASGVTALLDLGTASGATATDFEARYVSFEQAATPLSGVTVSAAAHRFQLIDCTWMGTANGPDRCVSIETKCHDWQIIRPRALFGQNGLDNEFLKSVAACTGYVIEDPILVGMDTLVVNLASSSAGPPDGLWVGGTVMYSAAVTSIEDGVAAATSLGLAFSRPLWAVDVTGKSGGKIPLTTAS